MSGKIVLAMSSLKQQHCDVLLTRFPKFSRSAECCLCASTDARMLSPPFRHCRRSNKSTSGYEKGKCSSTCVGPQTDGYLFGALACIKRSILNPIMFVLNCMRALDYESLLLSQVQQDLVCSSRSDYICLSRALFDASRQTESLLARRCGRWWRTRMSTRECKQRRSRWSW